MVVVLDECVDLLLQVAGQVVVFQQDVVLQGLVPPLDLALSPGMTGCAADAIHLSVFQPTGQIAREVIGPVVAEQPRLVRNLA